MSAAAFYAALAGLEVDGVRRAFGYEPNSINTADLPAYYVTFPGLTLGADSAWATACDDTGKSRTANAVLVVEAAGQDITAAAFAKVLTGMDALETALDSVELAAFQDYELRAGAIEKNGASFWAVIATVTVRG